MAFRTKKISQMDPKGSNLASTDLLEISQLVSGSYVTKSITGAEIIASVPPSVTSWGTITGTLSSQTDLQNALNAKVTSNTAITGATKTKVTYDSKGLVTAGADATTADIADSLNKRYVTDANLTVIGNTSGTNTGDQTLVGLGGVPTTRTLTINGTTQDLSADRTFTISTGITIGTTAITSGTVGRVLFEGTGNVVSESANLFWDNTNGRLGIGTSSPNSALEVVDTGAASYVAAARFLVPNNNVAGRVSQFYLGQAMTSLNSIAWSFHYQGNGSTANYQSFGFNGIATPALTMFGTLNIGINTTTDAGYKLDVNGTARVSGNGTLGITSTKILTIRPEDTTGAYGNSCSIRGGASNGRLDFYSATNITELRDNIILLTSVGGPSVQIGASSISLSVASAIRLQIAPTTGNVLINTTTDAGYKLDVNGTARINTVNIGLGGGQVAQNTILGYQAINGTATGNYNSAIGYQSLFSLTSGNFNTSIGRLALYTLTTGSQNTAVGAGSLQTNNGTGNISIGSGTMNTATSAYNVAIGNGALRATTGDFGTAVGDLALQANTSGIRNTAIGASALYTNTTGALNVAVGELALYSNNGSSNTAVGRQALQNNTTGANNSSLGFNTQSGNFSGCTIIGKDAIATANNQFVVGSTGTVAGAVTSEVNASTQVWNVIINGVARKILLA